MDDDFEGFDGDEGIQEDANVMEEEFADVGDTNDRMRLQAATHYFIGKICDNEEKNLDLTVSKKAIAALNEVLLDFAGVVAEDLEQFAKHAKRTTIRPDDILLCARRNKTLHKQLSDQVEQEPKKKVARKRKAEEGLDEEGGEDKKKKTKKAKTDNSKKDASSDL
jgi:centromere protein S